MSVVDVVVSVVGVCSCVCSRSKSVSVGPGLQRSSFADAGAVFTARFFPIVIECPKAEGRQVLVLVLVLVLCDCLKSWGSGAVTGCWDWRLESSRLRNIASCKIDAL